MLQTTDRYSMWIAVFGFFFNPGENFPEHTLKHYLIPKGFFTLNEYKYIQNFSGCLVPQISNSPKEILKINENTPKESHNESAATNPREITLLKSKFSLEV